MLSLAQLYTDDTNDDNDNDDDNDNNDNGSDTRQINYDYIRSLACMPNEPKSPQILELGEALQPQELSTVSAKKIHWYCMPCVQDSFHYLRSFKFIDLLMGKLLSVK